MLMQFLHAGKNTKGSTRLAGLVSPKRVVMSAYTFEDAEREEDKLAAFRMILSALGKK